MSLVHATKPARRPTLKDEAALEANTRAARRDVARNTASSLGDEPSTAWSPGYLPAETSPLVHAALDIAAFSISIVFEVQAGVTAFGEVARESKRLPTAHRAAGRTALARSAQDLENVARRGLTVSTKIIEYLAEARYRLAEHFAAGLDEYREGLTTDRDVFERAMDLLRLVLLAGDAGAVRGTVSERASAVPGMPLLGRLQAPTRAPVLIPAAELAEARKAVLGVRRLKRDDAKSRAAEQYDDRAEAVRARSRDSTFMSDVLAEYIERRADGDKRTAKKLAIACAESVRKRGLEDAMNFADSQDFFDDDAPSLPAFSL